MIWLDYILRFLGSIIMLLILNAVHAVSRKGRWISFNDVFNKRYDDFGDNFAFGILQNILGFVMLIFCLYLLTKLH